MGEMSALQTETKKSGAKRAKPLRVDDILLVAKRATVRLNNDYRGGRVFIELKGSETLIDAFEALPMRTKTEALRDMCGRDILQMLGAPSDTWLSFSKHAGCKMCPCSPGFIVEGVDFGRNIWVDIDITRA